MSDKQDKKMYEEFLQESISEFDKEHSINESKQKKIIQIGKNTARNTTVMISLAFLLLIIPIITLSTYLYYGINGKADKLIEITGQTLYVTKPNISLEEMEIEDEINLFSMKIDFDLFKKIGSEDYDVGDYSIKFDLGEARNPEIQWDLERPFRRIPMETNHEVLHHPNSLVEFNSEWSMLKGLPEGTVSEVYLSLRETMTKEELMKMMPSDVEVRWLAVDTGVEEDMLDSGGNVVSPIGYPAQYDSTTWSPFNPNLGGNENKSMEEMFLGILDLLEENEELAETVAERNLSINERREYIDNNGINIYGAVITGPTASIRKLESQHGVRSMKVGEVKLWNMR